jgi:mono/diheme cytochrome c family protein
VHPSCGCTTAELPRVPWQIPPGGNGQIKLTVNLQGKAGTLFKTVNVTTDHGRKDLILRINILPPPPMPEMTEAQRNAGIMAAKADRQAVFKGDCASCHLKKTEGKYGQQLFDALCAICHEASSRATMVPDLHNLQVPTNEEFWRTWITAGKAGSLMPAFASSQGGPLNDLQIASLAAYLNAINPSHVPPPAVK